ncbi:MAG: molybdate ABC transporter substrate-binding protein [Thalassovita sp.]
MHFIRRLMLVLSTCLLPAVAQAQEITVFAAASLRTALDEVVDAWHSTNATPVVMSYAGSSSLARQIEIGAPADVFISANQLWMDHLQSEGLLVEDTRVDLLGNSLVLIAAAGTPEASLEAALQSDLSTAPLAMGLVNAVPAGLYGKAALSHLGLWPRVAPNVAQVDNVRAALALVALGEASLGVVYATDALADPRVSVIAKFPRNTHPKITYPIAQIGGSTAPSVSEFHQFLTGPLAKQIFLRHGFTDPNSAE